MAAEAAEVGAELRQIDLAGMVTDLRISASRTTWREAATGRAALATAQEAPRLDRVRYEKIGEDICITGYPAYGRAASE